MTIWVTDIFLDRHAMDTAVVLNVWMTHLFGSSPTRAVGNAGSGGIEGGVTKRASGELLAIFSTTLMRPEGYRVRGLEQQSWKC